VSHLSIKRVARHLRVSENLVRSWLQTGLMEYGTFGVGKDKIYYVTEEELEKFRKKWGKHE